MEKKLAEIDNNSKAIKEEIEYIKEQLLKKQNRKKQTTPRITVSQVEQKGRFKIITDHTLVKP
jgi:hypothetical protein